MQQEFPLVQFVWVDIEDQSELVDPVEVENFPTLLISSKNDPCFFGTVTPHADTLRRLVQTYIDIQPKAWTGDQEIMLLAERLQMQTLAPLKA
jgi:thioredoxin 1